MKLRTIPKKCYLHGEFSMWTTFNSNNLQHFQIMHFTFCLYGSLPSSTSGRRESIIPVCILRFIYIGMPLSRGRRGLSPEKCSHIADNMWTKFRSICLKRFWNMLYFEFHSVEAYPALLPREEGVRHPNTKSLGFLRVQLSCHITNSMFAEFHSKYFYMQTGFYRNLHIFDRF